MSFTCTRRCWRWPLSGYMMRSEAVKAVVVLKPGMKASEEEIIEFCKERLAHYKAPKSVDFVDALPKTGSGKIAKGELRERCWKGLERRVH